MNSPKISIITVSYNVVSTIEKTILSVINQTYPNIEYIIIDGASTDGTIDIIKKYEDKIAYWISEPDKGIYDAMNKGILKATGDWINFINSGDSLLDEKAIEQFTNLHNRNADIIYGNTKHNIENINTSFIQEPKPIDSIEYNMPFGHPSSFVKAKLIKEILFDTTFKSSADYDFFLRCYRNNKVFQYIPVTIAVFDVGTGMSSNFKIYRHEKARIHGVEHKISWKINYTIDYIIWKLKLFIKSFLPESIKNKYTINRIHKNSIKKDMP